MLHLKKNWLHILVIISIYANIVYSADLSNNNHNNNKRSFDGLGENNNPDNDNNNQKKLKTEEDPKIKKERTQIFFKILDHIILNNQKFEDNTEIYLLYLIKLGIDINDDGGNSKNNGTVNKAIEKNRIDIVRFLAKQPNLILKSYIDNINEEEIQILLFTLRKGFKEITQELLKLPSSGYNNTNEDYDYNEDNDIDDTFLLDTLCILLLESKSSLDLQKCNFLLSTFPELNINSKFDGDWLKSDYPTAEGKTVLTLIAIITDMSLNGQKNQIISGYEKNKYDISSLLRSIEWLILNGADINIESDNLDYATHQGYKPSDSQIVQKIYKKHLDYIKKNILLNTELPTVLVDIIIDYTTPEKPLCHYESLIDNDIYDKIC